MGWVRDRWTERKRNREGGYSTLKNEDKSLIDVENVETTGEKCCHLSCRTPLNSSLYTLIGMKYISPTLMYIIPMYLRRTTFTKKLPQMSFHLYFFANFISLWGSTHDSADCLRQLQTCEQLMQAWVASAGQPSPKSWLRQC